MKIYRILKGNDVQPQLNFNLKISLSWIKLSTTGLLSIISFILFSGASFAGDPFRNTNSRNITAETELAFKALFEDGNYPQAKEYLNKAKNSADNDPMLPALRASLAYTEQDWKTMETYTAETLKVAKAIAKQDPLRSNLYLGVGNFLDGANEYRQKGAIAALGKLQLVFDYFEKAEKIDKNDPELNLIKGYLNLMLAVNLPFSSPQQAIDNLQTYASPQYLVNRGIALAYRDLKDYDLALTFVNKAIESTPLNPELYYLKGQILRQKGQQEKNIPLLQEAVKNFDIALAKIDQLPQEAVQKPLQREKRKTLEKISELGTSSSN
ncbi:Sll0314/Alr1548 family TPR repeat-containing protein [Geminocystis sp. GBBB08]|uniref:Sll0314/Alr1548 family TPR repeat-containing protein n=1 Tax=Geminocystis sp. GBBB08 TaxID=2604140 RepID=UPI0027E22A88|nr:Sll0314/Alr1548 family TPR repeat-containing protein [Geminocystis sp. GBBB08]MBL1210104.1 tetratricopeptide repeat protein [Geminocystis sp. GBBB08]